MIQKNDLFTKIHLSDLAQLFPGGALAPLAEGAQELLGRLLDGGPLRGSRARAVSLGLHDWIHESHVMLAKLGSVMVSF